MDLCREHHQAQHRLGWGKFLDKNPSLHEPLWVRGWELIEMFGVRKLVKRE